MRTNRVSVRAWLGALLFCLLVLFAWYNVEFYEDTEESSWSPEALANPYLAAELFMRQSGIDVAEVDGLHMLEQLDTIGTLFFSDANQVQSQRQLQRIMGWLEGGGNVIYAANSTAHEDDLLLQRFALEVDWAEYENENGEEKRSLSQSMREFNRQLEEGKSREEITRSMMQRDLSLTRVTFGDGIGDLDVAFDNSRVLVHPHVVDAEYSGSAPRPFSWSESDYGVHMMQFEVGIGLLTVISDPQVWTSYQVDLHDHAYLLWLLSAEQGDFVVMRSVVRDTIWSLMKKNTSELMIAAAALMLFWIWFAGYRFGRLQPRDDSRRRALGEHFSSISHYLWHRRHGAYLVTPLRQRVMQRASLKLAEFALADNQRQYELLAEHCDLNVTAIARAFNETDFNEASFVQTVRLLKRIEQSL